MSISSQLQTLVENKAAIKAAIEAKNPSVAPTDVLSNWPSSIASISGGGGCLPYESEVEYLESTGTQYINTGIYPADGLSFDLKAALMTGSSASTWAFFGGRNRMGGSDGQCSWWNTTGFYFYGWGNNNDSGGRVTRNFTVGTQYAFHIDKTGITIDETRQTTFTQQTAPTETNYPIYLFNSNNGGALDSRAGNFRVYGFKIKSNGATIRDFIPVRVERVGYLYDREHPYGGPFGNGLYPNSGSGNFILGPDVIPLEYPIPLEAPQYERPSDWPDITEVLASHPASAKGYGYAYAMLVSGLLPETAYNNRIDVPAASAGCRHYVTSWGLDEDASTAQTWWLTDPQVYSDYNWIVVYADSADALVPWGPSVTPAIWRWLLWVYAPGGHFVSPFTNTNLGGIVSLLEITADEIRGNRYAMSFGPFYAPVKVDVGQFTINFNTSYSTVVIPRIPTLRDGFKIVSSGAGATLANLSGLMRDCRYIKQMPDLSGVEFSAATSVSNFFDGCMSLEKADCSGWDVSKVTNFTSFFNNCLNLSYVDVSDWDTSSAALINNFFANCFNLSRIDVSGWNVSKVTSISYLFSHCHSLTTVNLSSWNLPACTSLAYSFYYCTSLTELDVSNFGLGACTSISNAFNQCQRLKSLDTTNWDLSNVTTIANAFTDCRALTTLGTTTWHISSKCTSFSGTFSSCYCLRSIQGADWDASKVTSLASMFANCYSLTMVEGTENWRVSTACTALNSMFSTCYSIDNLNLAGWNVSKVTNPSSMFTGCYNLKNLDLTGWSLANATSTSNMFSNCHLLETVDVSAFGLGKCATSNSMFATCYSLKTVDVSSWDTSKMTNPSSMFASCHMLETLDTSGWVFPVATNMASMFSACYNLKAIDVSKFGLAACTSLTSVFQDCHRIAVLDTSSWNTAKVTNINYLFSGCYSLTSVDISGWNLAKVTSDTNPFGGCNSLTTLIGGKTVASDGSINGSTAYWNKGVSINIAFSASPLLDHDSLLFLMYWLPSVSTKRTLTLGVTNRNKLSDDEKAVLTAKNWTIA